MTINRVSTAAIQQQTIRNATFRQGHLADLQNQISSSFKTDNFQGLSGQVESFVQLESKMHVSQNFIENNTIIKARAQTTEGAVSSVIDVMDDFKQLLMQRRNGATGQSTQFQVSGKATLQSIANLMNTSFEGRYLFGGTRTETPPVIVPVPETIQAGVPDASYYQGNSIDQTAEVQEGQNLAYGARADEGAFQKMFAAINLALKGDMANNQSQLDSAMELTNQAFAELTALDARLNQNIVNITDISERFEKQNLYWKGVTETIIKTDLVAASIEVSTDQAILQASFSSFATISALKLVDYLK